MKKVNFNQLGGFPLNTQMLTNLQNMQVFIEALGELAGDLSIIKGCVQTGQTIGNGVVYIDGELLEFRESQINNAGTVVVLQEVENAVFEDNNAKEVVVTKYAQFGIGVNQYDWSDFKRPYASNLIAAAFDLKADLSLVQTFNERLTVLELQNAIYQPGGVMFFWNKPINQIPIGFAPVADEQWKGRTVFNFDENNPLFNQIGKLVGKEGHAMELENLIRHKHVSYVKSNTNNFGVNGYYDQSAGGVDVPQDTSYTGSENPTPIPTIPPGKVCLYIEWVGLP